MKEIDKRVAEKVMLWHLEKGVYFTEDDKWIDSDGNFVVFVSDFSPSTNIADAFLVVEKMRELRWEMQLTHYKCGKGWMYECLFYKEDKQIVELAEAASLAICEAALKALENR